METMKFLLLLVPMFWGRPGSRCTAGYDHAIEIQVRGRNDYGAEKIVIWRGERNLQNKLAIRHSSE